MNLPELLVGMVISIIAFMIIARVFANFETQKRVTTSSSDVQSTGLIALTQIEQDVRSAGAGLNDPALFDCANIYSYYSDGASTTSPVPGYDNRFAPLVITDGGANGSDTIAIRSADSILGAIPTPTTEAHAQGGNTIKVTRAAGFAANQLALVASGNNCMVFQITQVMTTANQLQHNPSSNWNPNNGYQNSHNWPSFSVGSQVFSIGNLTLSTYSVNANRQLQVRVQSGSDTVDILNSDIVSLQAQYGVASSATAADVSAWVEPTGTWAATALDTTAIGRIRAIRVALVARSPRMENTDVSAPCTNVSGTVNQGPCLWRDSASALAPTLNLSADANWKRYRYRVFQTIIPLRNMVWIPS